MCKGKMKTNIFLLFLSFLGVAWTFESQCEQIFDDEVSDYDAKIIVDKHNELRSLLANGMVENQPSAKNLKIMKYDYTLAAEAQKIANTCVFEHKTVNDGRWHAVGQNLYITYSTGKSNTKPDWPQAIQGWFDEYKDYKFGPCCEKGPKMTGHYTQVVWADTEYVGCGYTYFATKDVWAYRKLYVCNYGPAGNYLRQLPYIAGDSGDKDVCCEGRANRRGDRKNPLSKS